MAQDQNSPRSYGILKDKDINFYKMYYKRPERTKEQKSRNGFILSLVAVVLLIGAVFGTIDYKVLALNSQLKQIKAYTDNPSTVAQYAAAQSGETAYAETKKVYNNFKNLEDVLASYAALSKEDFDTIDACGGSVITTQGLSFDQNTSTLSFTAVASSYSALPDYVGRLLKTGLFTSVSYGGYTQDGTGNYQSVITCIVKAAKTND